MTGPHRQTSATSEVSLGWLPTIDRIQLPKLLKEQLTQDPILTYPEFLPSSEPFSLQTDASAVGIGMVLEQAGYVVAYASRSLTQSERNYNADSLSQRPAPVAATTCTSELPDLLQHQGKDRIIHQLSESLQSLSPPHGPAWRQPPLRHIAYLEYMVFSECHHMHLHFRLLNIRRLQIYTIFANEGVFYTLKIYTNTKERRDASTLFCSFILPCP